jgi:hypothetical protein
MLIVWLRVMFRMWNILLASALSYFDSISLLLINTTWKLFEALRITYELPLCPRGL